MAGKSTMLTYPVTIDYVDSNQLEDKSRTFNNLFDLKKGVRELIRFCAIYRVNQGCGTELSPEEASYLIQQLTR